MSVRLLLSPSLYEVTDWLDLQGRKEKTVFLLDVRFPMASSCSCLLLPFITVADGNGIVSESPPDSLSYTNSRSPTLTEYRMQVERCFRGAIEKDDPVLPILPKAD